MTMGPSDVRLSAGQLFIVLGIACVAVGLLLIFGARFSALHLGRLPGDIRYRGKDFQFYFPVVTCLLLSLVVTLILWGISFLTRK